MTLRSAPPRFPRPRDRLRPVSPRAAAAAACDCVDGRSRRPPWHVRFWLSPRPGPDQPRRSGGPAGRLLHARRRPTRTICRQDTTGAAEAESPYGSDAVPRPRCPAVRRRFPPARSTASPIRPVWGRHSRVGDRRRLGRSVRAHLVRRIVRCWPRRRPPRTHRRGFIRPRPLRSQPSSSSWRMPASGQRAFPGTALLDSVAGRTLLAALALPGARGGWTPVMALGPGGLSLLRAIGTEDRSSDVRGNGCPAAGVVQTSATAPQARAPPGPSSTGSPRSTIPTGGPATGRLPRAERDDATARHGHFGRDLSWPDAVAAVRGSCPGLGGQGP